MVRDYSVISKGKYEYKQTSEFLKIERFLIVRKKKRRMLLLDLENTSEETLTALKLQVEQFDVRGKDLGPTTFELKTSYKQGKFILKKAIELHHSCIDFRVKVVYAEYGNYVYRLGDEDTYVTYEKKKKRKKLNDSAIRKKTGKEGHSEKKRAFKAPVFVGLFAAVVILASAGLSFLHLQSYKEEKEQFFLQNLKYEFIDGNKAEGAPVYITGYIGLGGEDIVIPNSVEGHPVQGIAQGAFANNSIIETLTVQKGVVISVDAFYNCSALRSVTLLGDNAVEDYAFAQCSNLETVKATDLIYAGNMAFSNASDLQSLRIESSAGNQGSVIFGEKVVTGAREMTEIYIDRYIAYGETCQYFDNIGSVETLYLKNMNYAAYSSDGALDKTLGDMFGENGAKIGKFEIKYADTIPAFLTEKCNKKLTSFKVSNLTETTVGEAAFKDCEKLTTVDIPKLITEVGANAYEGTAITSFNALALQKMGAGAFKNCKALADFQLDVISELTSIPKEAFSGCESLALMYVPAKVEKIGDKAFYECKEMATLTFAMDGVLESIGDNAFELCKKLVTLNLPTKLETIGSGAFKTCNRLNYISIPQSVTAVESDAFAECYRLYEIENLSYTVDIIPGVGLGEYSLMVYTSASDARMPRKIVGDYEFGHVDDTWYLLWYHGSDSELTLPTGDGLDNYVVQSYLFIDTEGITAVNIPNQAAVVGKKVVHESDVSRVSFTDGSAELTFTKETFNGCDNLVELNFNSRTFYTIEEGMFSDCASLSKIVLPTYLTTIGVSAFAGCESLTSVSGGRDVQIVDDSAFNGCTKLTSFAFGSNLTTIGAYAFKGCKALTNCTGANSLVTIKNNAFEGCASLSAITLPETLTSIGEYAFLNCSSLKNVVIPTLITSLGQETFSGCSSLVGVSSAKGLLYMGDRVFYECSSLVSVAMPALTEMGEECFSGCSSLGNVEISATLLEIPTAAFYNSGVQSISGGSNLTTIGTQAFYNCARLSSLTLPTNVQTIGEYAFYSCSQLSTLKLNLAVEVIGQNAFAECKKLSGVTINDGLSTLGYGVFENCTSLQYVNIGDNVGTVGGSAFRGCTSLKSVTVGNDVGTISADAFAECKALQTVTIGESLYKIGASAFNGCSALQSVTFGYGLEQIGESAFYQCTALTYVELPDSVSYLGGKAFYQCTALTEARLSSNLSQINAETFYGCKNLETVWLGSKLSSIGSDAFRDCDHLYEIYNLSNLKLTCNSPTYGYVAYNAVAIHTDENASLETVTIGNYVFKTTGSTWALVKYNGTETSLTLDTISNTRYTVDSYEIARYAFKEYSQLQNLAIGEAVTSIRSYAFSGLSGLKTLNFDGVSPDLSVIPANAFCGTWNLESVVIPLTLSGLSNRAFDDFSSNFRVYYRGDMASWYSYGRSKYGTNNDAYVYYYDECIHYEREWSDKNGSITTAKKDFIKEIIREPSCTESGETHYYCNTCTDEKFEYPSALGHSMQNSVCTRCGYMEEMLVQKSSLSQFRTAVTITNNSTDPFDLFETTETEIHAPDVYSAISTLTFTAKKAIRLSFVASALGDCTLTVKMTNGGVTRTRQVGSYSSFDFDLDIGATVEFIYVDNRVVVEEPDEPSVDSSSSSSGSDSSSPSDSSSADDSSSSEDWNTNYSSRESDQFASAYIHQICVWSLD